MSRMQVGIAGVGRLGSVLVRQLADSTDVFLFDRDSERAARIARETGVREAGSLMEAADGRPLILAVPDREVLGCIREMNGWGRPVDVVSVATNVGQQVLEETAVPPVRCISAKFVSQAGEMAIGQRPVIVINEEPKDLAVHVAQIFIPAGHVIIGQADIVGTINTIASRAALQAAVTIETQLQQAGISGETLVNSAIGQVAAGVLKGYAANDLGPFAKELVQSLKTGAKV